jgi:cytochrome c-type biogenesis protein CcmE
VNNPSAYLGTYVRVIGNVSSSHLTAGGAVEFNITDGEASIRVVYRGNLPATWAEGVPVVVAGRLVSEDLIEADQVLTQCPSKYER